MKQGISKCNKIKSPTFWNCFHVRSKGIIDLFI